MTQPDGLLLVDKPQGITSHDAVAIVRRAQGTKKVGHAGTLDPMATGLLLMGVGRATRLLRFLGDLPKVYEGTMRLGIETSTLDADGEVTREADVTATDAKIHAAMAALLGDSMQAPPAYSAVKVGGTKLYEAARKGQTLEAAPRPIRVAAFDLLGYDGRDAGFRVVCGGGTYVRVLAADVGAALGCGAHLTALRRTAIGPFDVAEAGPPDVAVAPLPIERVLDHLPRVDLGAEEAVAAGHGRILGPAGIAGPYGVFGPDDRLIGVWEDDGTKGRPLVVLPPLDA
ncbi:MAG: tRNA pseudouridine(55) synthase TruB [Actinomycetota bacterium]